MAEGVSRSSFENNAAWVEVHYDDVALEMVSVVYQNATAKRAIVEITQGNKTDTFTATAGVGVPDPVTQAVPHNRYTYHLNAKGDLASDFTYQVTFKA